MGCEEEAFVCSESDRIRAQLELLKPSKHTTTVTAHKTKNRLVYTTGILLKKKRDFYFRMIRLDTAAAIRSLDKTQISGYTQE
jgi:hypothetical protein